MTREFYSRPDCSVHTMVQTNVICDSFDLTAGSLYNGTDNNDNDFFTTE